MYDNQWTDAVLQKCSDQIANALERAAAAEQRARDAVEPEYRSDNERMAESWRLLARSFQYVESLEKFLIDSKPYRNLLPAESLKKHPWE
jgi:hypothetical protein